MDRGRGDGEERVPGIDVGVGVIDLTAPPVKDMVDSLVAMGIARSMAEMAVQETGADTAESAIAWVFENGMTAAAGEGNVDEGLLQEYKMVFAVNTSLPMTPGKMAAQVGHAAIGLYQELVSKQDVFGGPLLQWDENGSKKIVLQCKDANHLNELAALAEKEGLPYMVIQDAGRTQIQAGSQTVLGIFGLVKAVDKVTGELRLLP